MDRLVLFGSLCRELLLDSRLKRKLIALICYNNRNVPPNSMRDPRDLPCNPSAEKSGTDFGRI